MTDSSDTGEITADELQQIQSPDQIGERYYQHFLPNSDGEADDDSWADSGDVPD